MRSKKNMETGPEPTDRPNGDYVPFMRTKDVIAVVVADIHLSLRPPIARSKEPDWFQAMARPLSEIHELARVNCNAPILCAGDIFDKWNSPPELINFALEFLPDMYAIAGQHDQPLHSMEDIKRSAYWTLVEAGKIVDVSDTPKELPSFYLRGYPYGTDIKPIPPKERGGMNNVALVHEYVWTTANDCSYPGAPIEALLTSPRIRKRYTGHDMVVFGDNHKGFSLNNHYDWGKQVLWNCGTMMRRKSDEISYRPTVGLILTDGSVVPHHLNCSQDIIEKTEAEEPSSPNPELTDFLEDLMSLQNTSLDFAEAIRRTLDKVKPGQKVREILLKAMET